jgi:ribosomal protein L5
LSIKINIKLEKIVVSAGLGLNAQNRVYLQKATEEIRLITGQQPVISISKKINCVLKFMKECL